MELIASSLEKIKNNPENIKIKDVKANNEDLELIEDIKT